MSSLNETSPVVASMNAKIKSIGISRAITMNGEKTYISSIYVYPYFRQALTAQTSKLTGMAHPRMS